MHKGGFPSVTQIVTSHQHLGILRSGRGPLPFAQRIGFSIIGLICVFGGAAILWGGLFVPEDSRQLFGGQIFSTVVSILFVSGALFIGLIFMILGFRTLRHMI